jgi:hypothetical protein
VAAAASGSAGVCRTRPAQMGKGSVSAKQVVPVERIELPTFGLQNRCSTAELNRQTRGKIIRSHPGGSCRLCRSEMGPTASAPSNTRLVGRGLQQRKAPRKHPARAPDAIIAPWNHGNHAGIWRGSCRSRRFLSCRRFWPQHRPPSARRIRRSASPMRGPRWSRCGKGWRARVAARACRGRAGRPSFRFTTNGVSRPRARPSPLSGTRARKF